MAEIKTWTEEAEELTLRSVLLEQLDERFGPLSEQVGRRLAEMPTEKLQPMVRAMMRARSLRDLGLEDDLNEAAT
jgi:hypothetical protein